MNVLNLYAGIGGNRKLWEGCDITAIEYDPKIAAVYQKLYPDDTVIVCDAHQYLLENFQDFDFIWSSPPCPSHSRMIRSGKNRKPRYPDMKLYEEIIHLQHNFKGHWVVENVKPYYAPLIEAREVGRHLFWSNFDIGSIDIPPQPKNFINQTNLAGKYALMNWLDIHFEEKLYIGKNHCPAQVLRNCVHPLVGKQVLDNLKGLNYET
tara:strand:- start:38 stop:658 length:621 start_codon:yes stop_codon:yes gene_type:complete